MENRYDKYKDSGIAWIGVIPEHWEITLFKRKITINNGKDYKNFSDAEIYPVIGSGGCFAYCSNYMYDGEALLLGRKGTIDKPLYVKGKFWAVDTMFYAIPHKDLHCKFSYYLALTFPFNLYSTSTSLPSLTQTDLGNIPVAFPSISEQQAIADYLDRRCSEIDDLIALQEEMITKLQSYKQSVITEAVTRGLDKNVPLKDSGIDWIGKIPKHWEIVKIKNIFNISSGATPKTDNMAYWDGEIIWITPADYKTEDKIIKSGKRNITLAGLNSCGTSIIPKDSIIFSKRAPIGLVAINVVPLCTNQGCISCIPKSFVYSKYFYFLMSVLTEWFELFGSGTTFKELSTNNFANFNLSYPPLAEQQAIADYLDQRCSEIDELIALKQQKIEKLKEYKKSLIFECVTGKRKVS